MEITPELIASVRDDIDAAKNFLSLKLSNPVIYRIGEYSENVMPAFSMFADELKPYPTFAGVGSTEEILSAIAFAEKVLKLCGY